ncbi:MAG: hypothetical protein ACP5XB_18490 [Isosphaeraceae bacterium]
MTSAFQMRLCVTAAILWVALGAVLFGVGGDDPTHVSLFGSVKVDGKPVERGAISFFLITPTSGGMTDVGSIHHGRFVLDRSNYLVPGTYNVMIQRLPDTDVRDGAGEESKTSPLPERSNPISELELEIPRGGSSRLEFSIKS